MTPYRCPAGERLTFRCAGEERGKVIRRYWMSACAACPLKAQCTTGPERWIPRWEHEAVLEAVQARLDKNPNATKLRRQTAENPFVGTRAATAHSRVQNDVNDVAIVFAHFWSPFTRAPASLGSVAREPLKCQPAVNSDGACGSVCESGTIFTQNSLLSNAIWRRERDSNPRDSFPPTRVPGVRLQPLGHLSSGAYYTGRLALCKLLRHYSIGQCCLGIGDLVEHDPR